MSVAQTALRALVLWNGASFLVAALMILTFQCRLRCSVTIAVGAVSVLVALIALLAIWRPTESEAPAKPAPGGSRQLFKRLLPGALWAFILALAAHLFLLSPLPVECCRGCKVNDGPRLAIAKELIRLESKAVLKEDMDLIKQIFSADARVINAGSNQHLDAVDYYRTKFQNEEHWKLSHFDLSKVFGTEPDAPYRFETTTSSEGQWRFETERELHHYRGKDLWKFQRNPSCCCCWQIVELTFNRPG